MSEHDYAIGVLTERKINISKEQDKYDWNTIGWNEHEEYISKLESAIKRLKQI